MILISSFDIFLILEYVTYLEENFVALPDLIEKGYDSVNLVVND
ncbi:hypothetical protein SLEP1_g46259 [Rubroshorea leprosula]|uniref:Uncharacterized protein n=1 Tax=Rubroshorea leprosula TaxID=152421 RepID=A0AAV5LP94_9ROSI|nr:hypothetical protein SLEP1_g46259 [Rubroshorea leprosula]